jgi:membrane protease YdiL (CAAX protease family)
VTASERREYPFWSWEDLAIFGGLLLPSLLLSAMVVQIAAYFSPQSFKSAAMRILPFQALVYFFLFASLWALLRMRYDAPFWRSLAWNFRLAQAWKPIILGPLLAISISVTGVLIKAPVLATPFEDMTRDRGSSAAFLFFAVVLGPLCEELAFRGFLFPLVERATGGLSAIIVSALPFALLHGQQYQWSWQHVLLVFLAGCGFGWLRYRSGSTAAATLLHSTYNLTFFLGLMVLRALIF